MDADVRDLVDKRDLEEHGALEAKHWDGVAPIPISIEHAISASSIDGEETDYLDDRAAYWVQHGGHSIRFECRCDSDRQRCLEVQKIVSGTTSTGLGH